MQASTEVRWFFSPQEDTSALSQWFAGFGKSLNPPEFERADYYLQLPGTTNLGAKIREPKNLGDSHWKGKFELKILARELGALQLENGSVGNANQWSKFSFEIKEGDKTMAEVLNSFLPAKANPERDEHWIKMEKHRLLVLYDQQRKIFDIDQEKVTEGCGIELTTIRINDELNYSFAFESFSAAGKQEEIFFEALNYFFSEVSLPPLPGDRSFGYPTFLAEKVSGQL